MENEVLKYCLYGLGVMVGLYLLAVYLTVIAKLIAGGISEGILEGRSEFYKKRLEENNKRLKEPKSFKEVQ